MASCPSRRGTSCRSKAMLLQQPLPTTRHAQQRFSSQVRSHKAAARRSVRPAAMALTGVAFNPNFGAVAIVGVASAFLHNFWMAFKVGKARRQYNVKYPTLYAPDSHPNANEFNCVQRAHQNSLENFPQFLGLLLLGGAFYPLTASAAGAVYLLGRIVYFQGYSTGEPDKRLKGAFSYFGLLGLYGTVLTAGVKLLLQKPL